MVELVPENNLNMMSWAVPGEILSRIYREHTKPQNDTMTLPRFQNAMAGYVGDFI